MGTTLDYDFGCPIYGLAFSSSVSPASSSKSSVSSPGTGPSALPHRIAVASYIEGYQPNSLRIIAPSASTTGPTSHAEPDQDWSYADDGGDMQMRRSSSAASRSLYYPPSPSMTIPSAFVDLVQEPHPYPCTNVAFAPERLAATMQAPMGTRDMLATTSECLRLFDLVYDGAAWQLQSRAALATSKSEFPAPLTSFSWSTVEPSLIVSSSVDTTCTIWDIQQGSAITQLIAHDREVYDVSWSPTSRDVFASVGADGSVRMFDIRSLEHSTILYEVSGAVNGSTALLRLAFNPNDENRLAIVHADSSDVYLLDVRKPSVPMAELHAHRAAVNAFAWNTRSALATAGDDCQVLVWDLSPASGNLSPQPVNGSGSSRITGGATGGKVLRQPSLATSTPLEINNVAFSGGDYIGAALGSMVRFLKV